MNSKWTHQVKKQLKDSVFLGRIATDAEIRSQTPFHAPVWLSERSDKLTFYIKCLSPLPDEITSPLGRIHPYLEGTTNSTQNRRMLNDELGLDRIPYPEVKDKVEEFFEGKLILFTVTLKNDRLYVDLQKVEPGDAADKYFIIPAPDLKAQETREDLEAKLTTERRPITLKKYPNLFDAPTMMIFGERLYQVDLSSKSNSTTYFQAEDTDPDFVDLEPEFHDLVDVIYDHHLFFFSKENYRTMQDKLARGRTHISEKKEEPVLSLMLEREPDEQPEPPTLPVSTEDEFGFLERLKWTAKQQEKMMYRDEDLYAFHMSVKTNPLTILGGMSGTGKSRLARIYGKTLGLKEDENLLFLPISPAYQEPNDLLGYFNPVTNRFHESETGLIRLLQHAEDHPEQLHMVIFDEMNLAQVEHWFSPFLSLLEVKNSNERHLKVFNSEEEVASDAYRPRIKLGDNLIFIGTVNFDETTQAFSDRLLDRTNIISPKKPSFKEAALFYQETKAHHVVSPGETQVSTESFRSEWKVPDAETGLDSLTEFELHTLDELHHLISANDPQKGVSFRVALAISEYLQNVPKDRNGEVVMDRKRLFDLQINQRILTKIKGMDTFVRPLVGEMMNTGIELEYEDGDLSRLFKSPEAQFASSFEESLRTLENKAKELMMYGFTN
ncbi:hypothetical protein LCM20_09225 [Halobacillus litoralis]|uniref:McrB family protein n=1 Tax=Halobacillus litoralis TaxID=45668 RepID=UPI001CD6DDEF|nr:hypothetical protein [Halobacillus litoralis]MCA0970769.1 hypothetical protein [Halobacillus litoralis]